MDLMGLCSICGKPDAMFTCRLCGRLVCRNCFDMHNSACCFCTRGKD